MKYVVYGRLGVCPHCDNAKEFLESRKIEFEFLDVDETEGAMDAIKKDGFRSIPAIYFNDGESDKWEVVGGFTELQTHKGVGA